MNWQWISALQFYKPAKIKISHVHDVIVSVLHPTSSWWRFTWSSCMQPGLEKVGHFSSMYCFFSFSASRASSSSIASPICSSKLWEEGEERVLVGLCGMILTVAVFNFIYPILSLKHAKPPQKVLLCLFDCNYSNGSNAFFKDMLH